MNDESAFRKSPSGHAKDGSGTDQRQEGFSTLTVMGLHKSL